jgi:hypothetical protein
MSQTTIKLIQKKNGEKKGSIYFGNNKFIDGEGH